MACDSLLVSYYNPVLAGIGKGALGSRGLGGCGGRAFWRQAGAEWNEGRIRSERRWDQWDQPLPKLGNPTWGFPDLCQLYCWYGSDSLHRDSWDIT